MTNQTSEFSNIPLNKADLSPDPIKQFQDWYQQAQQEIEPSAMTLATVSRQYDITARMVLLKAVDEQGFVFFTNYESLKAEQLNQIAQAALVFWWPKCQRQVRVTGQVAKVSREVSSQYFQQRSRESQIAAIVSKQSAQIPNRMYLVEKYQNLAHQKQDQVLECPENWGGYIVRHEKIEFWQGREHRLHDRFLYQRTPKGWEIVQLSP